jgi:ubiquinone/menaquinone biosynthesis C-methylase UbiE
MSVSATRQSIEHWSQTPLYYSQEERYCRYPWLSEAAEFRDHRGERVLEIGCGTGCDLLQFAKHGAEAVGIDITPAHLKLAAERINRMARLVRADATALPFRDKSFDYVYSHGVLHHLEKPREAVKEILRVLRPGGPLDMIRMHGFQWKRWIENSRDPVHIRLYSSRKLRKLFAPIKVEIERHEGYFADFLARWWGWFLVARGTKYGR